MSRIDRRSLLRAVATLLAAGPLAALLLATVPAQGQQPQAPPPAVPSEPALEILVKQTLLTFNDANLTGNYSVFHASLADSFRRQFTVDQVRDAFREFNQQQIDLAGIILHRFRLQKPAAIGPSSALEVEGRFDTRPFNIVFQLFYLPGGNGEWRLAHLDVNLVPNDQVSSGAGQPPPGRPAQPGQPPGQPAQPAAPAPPGGPSRGAKGRM